ncbi:MAG TPA: DUF885 domain-containing protein [Polyangiaceae bacterium]|nr:DUF885 domain-containing protein [Polyangiaceae bacterium]
MSSPTRYAKAWSVVLPLLLGACGAQSRTSTCKTAPSTAATTAATASTLPEWIQRSNAIADILLGVQARFLPELASRYGVERVDDQILDLKPGHGERYRAALRDAITTIETRGAAETDARVRRDVAILVKAARLYIKDSELREANEVPYYNPTEIIFNSMQGLLDEQVPAPRRERAVGRLRKYAGLEGGPPIVELAKAETRERFGRAGLAAPNRLAVEKHLTTNGHIRAGIGELLRKYQIAGHEEPYKALMAQLAEYDAFVKSDVLPKARPDFALPPAIYALNLERFGVDIPPAELVERAHRAFTEIQKEMTDVAQQIAAQRKLPSSDYRDIIRELKKDQLVGDAILPHYKQRLGEVEAIIRREKLVTLPDRPARIRLGTPAENAQQPAPHMVPPRLLGNTGEQGEFVLPLSVPAPEGSQESAQKLDDFTFAAASWTLTAHEARPGHEMQFASLVERGVSTARAIYAFNSTNVEGWGLYSEYIMVPFMPLEGKLISLQLRLQRAVRAFIDPELQAGKWTFESAWAFLEKEVGLSHAFAKSEVERYTFRAPGQATSYFYGYTRLLELRRDIEQKLQTRFDAQRFHDFVLSQGLLPPDLLREAVMTELAN